MAMQWITRHGFQYFTEVKSREELGAEAPEFEGWLYIIFVLGLTLFFAISFLLL